MMGPQFGSTEAPNTIATLNAATDKLAFIGYAYIDGRAASKTISAAGGGSISFRTGTVTFANGSTSVTVGIQDVDATNGPPVQPDGSFDVASAALVGGGGGITTAAWNTITMTGGSGSKTIAQGDLIAVVIDMTARGGADSVVINSGIPTAYQLPACVEFAGAWTDRASAPNCLITFDDGTLGIIDSGMPFTNISTELYADSDNPDERGMIFQVPFECKVDGLMVRALRASGTTSDATLTLYETPTGTPASLAAVTVLADQLAGSSAGFITANLASEITLAANTDYCLAFRATGAGQIGPAICTFANEAYRTFLPGGTTLAKATRNNGSGAFTPQSPAVTMYHMAVRISAVEASAGGGAGGAGSRMLRGVGI
jgi:hypothetical protein